MVLTRYAMAMVVLCVAQLSFSQQVSIDNTIPIEDLIENTLIQGCVEVSNITSPTNGAVDGFGSFGYFESANSNFPFQNGIVLSTGNAYSGGNTETHTNLSEGTTNWQSDTDLESVLGVNDTFNATVVEFDFISATNNIQFNYILASEEYFLNNPCEYADGFAFLIREVGTTDYQNIARIPNANTPVNTSTIRPEIQGFCDAQNASFFEGYDLGDTNFNGRTSVLTATANIQPNVHYQIKLVIADQTDQNFDSAVFIEGRSFNTVVNLGDDIATCESNISLDVNVTNPQASYTWFYNDTEITGANQPMLNVTENGNYRIEVSTPFAGQNCVIEDAINVTLNTVQQLNPISNYQICSSDVNTPEVFTLNTKNSEAIASLPTDNYTITYHSSSSDALNNVNSLQNSYQNLSNPQTIYVRIANATGCISYTYFDLRINTPPNFSEPTPLLVCISEEDNGVAQINLNEKNDEITNANPSLHVTYYATASEASLGSNPLPNPYISVSPNQIVYARVDNTTSGCSVTTPLSVVISNAPTINMDPLFLDGCDDDYDGYANFDLTDSIDDVIGDLENVTIYFYETQADALACINAIPNYNTYNNTVPNIQTIYMRVEDNSSGCNSYRSFEIHTNLLLTETIIEQTVVCDTNNDGQETLAMSILLETIINDLPNLEVEVYVSETDRANYENDISGTSLYTIEDTLITFYLRILSDTCSQLAEIQVVLTQPGDFEPVESQVVCDQDQDGITTTNLSQFNALVTEGDTTNFEIQYFLSEDDAQTETNEIPTNYTNTTNPFRVYTRITNRNTNCANANNSFLITVIDAPITSPLDPITYCDDDSDGFMSLNLTDYTTQITNQQNVTVRYFNTLSNAENNTNAIENPTNYNAQTETIVVKVENNTTGCAAYENLSISINSFPIIQNIDTYIVCENNNDDTSDFYFNTKDAEILNGQSGMSVLYFETASDAQNRTNSINKNTAFTNTSNPQEIFVRLEHSSNISCFNTSSFFIKAGANPIFTAPKNMMACDDFSNDGVETFNLNIKTEEITNNSTENLTVTYHTSYTDAENGTNQLPLLYQNSSSTQDIYARIGNEDSCYVIANFELVLIPVPDVIDYLNLTTCDTNYDGIASFDISQASNNIVDVRLDNLEFNYYPTSTDMLTNTNEITTPENYNNISNPQTAILKVTNTISGCYSIININMQVNLPPQQSDLQVFDICETPDNTYDLSGINDTLLVSPFNTNVAYYNTLADAQQQANPIVGDYTYNSTTTQLFARVSYSTTGCFYIHPFNLVVSSNPVIGRIEDIAECDDDFDGIYTFNLTTRNSAALNDQNPNTFNVSYYNTIDDAIMDTNALNALSHPAENNSTIYARLTNIATGCFDVTSFNAFVYRKPAVNIPNQALCTNKEFLVISAQTNVDTDTYSWSFNDAVISNQPEIEITQPGVYTVTVTSYLGCTTTEAFTISESETANIDSVEVVDFSDPNNITITVNGIGNYEHQLNDGIRQTSNHFNNVPLGYHTITVYDLNGCGAVTRDVLVIDYPKFFTPNGDADNPTWHIIGVDTLPGTVVTIFDRYGKVLTKLNSNSQGWDGLYRGNKMPASDYWFTADVVRGNQSFQIQGHFALRR